MKSHTLNKFLSISPKLYFIIKEGSGEVAMKTGDQQEISFDFTDLVKMNSADPISQPESPHSCSYPIEDPSHCSALVWQ